MASKFSYLIHDHFVNFRSFVLKAIQLIAEIHQISRSKQLESAIPASKISALSSGEFVGMVADDPDNKIDLKAFHCEILNDHEALRTEQEN